MGWIEALCKAFGHRKPKPPQEPFPDLPETEPDPIPETEPEADPPPTSPEPTVSPETKRVIDSILSVFETGKLPSPASYGTATILRDGAGISYGKHQSTDRSDTLDTIVLRYIDQGGAHADALRPFVDRLARDETTKVDPANPPQWTQELLGILRAAGSDPIMQRAQDEVFDELYWLPAMGHVKAMQLATPLSHLVVYDTCIHSGPRGVANIRKRFPERPPATGGDEKVWTEAYVRARRAWLASHPNEVVQNTVYRMDTFQSLIDASNWNLHTPITVLRVTIS